MKGEEGRKRKWDEEEREGGSRKWKRRWVTREEDRGWKGEEWDRKRGKCGEKGWEKGRYERKKVRRDKQKGGMLKEKEENGVLRREKGDGGTRKGEGGYQI